MLMHDFQEQAVKRKKVPTGTHSLSTCLRSSKPSEKPVSPEAATWKNLRDREVTKEPSVCQLPSVWFLLPSATRPASEDVFRTTPTPVTI